MGNYPLDIIDNSNTRLLLQAADRLGIEWTMLDDDRYQVLFEKDGKSHLQQAHSFRINPSDGIELTHDKVKTYEALQAAHLPVLPKVVVTSQQEYQSQGVTIPFPQVIKPIDGEKGRSVYLNIPDKTAALTALDLAFKNYSRLVVEPYFPGNDIRMMCLDHQVIGISQRHPPQIAGDGIHTIEQLIELENARRLELNAQVDMRMLNQMRNLERISWYLERYNLQLSTVLPESSIQRLHDIPNYSAGGSVSTLTKEQLHPSFVTLAETISQVVNLTICGIDFVVKDLQKEAKDGNVAIIEVNSDPGIRLHDLPNEGESQHVADKILQYYFRSQ